MTRGNFCAEHRSICVKMGRAMAKACSFMHEHPKEAMAMLGKRLNVKDPAVLAEAYKHTHGVRRPARPRSPPRNSKPPTT